MSLLCGYEPFQYCVRGIVTLNVVHINFYWLGLRAIKYALLHYNIICGCMKDNISND